MAAFRALRHAAKGLWPIVTRDAYAARVASPCLLPTHSDLSPVVLSSARTLQSSVRAFGLADSLKRELADLDKTPPEDEDELKNVPAGWKVGESPGSSLMTLQKTFPGNEKVTVEFDVTDHGADDDGLDPAREVDDDEVTTFTLLFSVACEKGDQVVKFECSYTEGIDEPPIIRHIGITPKGGHPKDVEDHMYTGPLADELDETLMEDLADYLQQRDITAEFANWLCVAAYDKEQREYRSWLEKFQKFVQS